MSQPVVAGGPQKGSNKGTLDPDEPFEEVYNRHAKVGVIQEKVFSLEDIDRKGRRLHRKHPRASESWFTCDHPECEIWQVKYDSTPSPGDTPE